jgi:hypothetical protein
MRYAGAMTLEDVRTDIDLAWISDVLSEIDSLLNPAPFKKQEIYGELRAAAVPERTIATLYPFEPFAHAPGVAQLVRLPEFLKWATFGGWRYYSGHLRAGLPKLLHQRVSDSLRTVENPIDHTFTYYAFDPYDPEQTALMQLPAKRLFRTPGRIDRKHQKFVAEDLLMLPLTLQSAAEYPFREYGDDELLEAAEFQQRLEKARREVVRFMNLVRKQAQFIDLSAEGQGA